MHIEHRFQRVASSVPAWPLILRPDPQRGALAIGIIGSTVLHVAVLAVLLTLHATRGGQVGPAPRDSVVATVWLSIADPEAPSPAVTRTPEPPASKIDASPRLPSSSWLQRGYGLTGRGYGRFERAQRPTKDSAVLPSRTGANDRLVTDSGSIRLRSLPEVIYRRKMTLDACMYSLNPSTCEVSIDTLSRLEGVAGEVIIAEWLRALRERKFARPDTSRLPRK